MGDHSERDEAVNDDLPRRLRVTAEGFGPDSERMWARVASGMPHPESVKARPAKRGFRIPHMAIATGVAVVLIGAIVVIGYGPDMGGPSGPSAGSPPSEAEPTETTSPDPVGHKPELVDELAYLSADGAINDDTENDYWSQAKLTMVTDEPLTELTVELHVVNAVDLETTGSWVTAEHYFDPPEIVEEDGYLIYRWTLKEGQTVEPGEYLFAGQHNHRNGKRDESGDYYVFEAVGATGEGTVIGDFPPRD